MTLNIIGERYRMRVNFTDCSVKGHNAIFQGNKWSVIKNYEVKDRTGIPFRSDMVLQHKVTNETILILKLEKSLKFRRIQISTLGVMKRSLDNIDLAVVSPSIRRDEKLIIDSLGCMHLERLGISDSDGSIKWLCGENSNGISKRRDRTGMVREMMLLMKDHGCKITEVVYKCNLNYETATNILDDLIAKNLVAVSSDGGTKKYRITANGSEFVKMLSSIEW